jgi:hypothetical protein
MCGCQVQILVLPTGQQSEIEQASCVWFNGSNFAPWTQTIVMTFLVRECYGGPKNP